jgi:ribonuclease HI
MTNIVRIFTDGSAIGNPGPGGWGAVVIEGSKRREMSGAFPWVTISEMELLAAVEALRSIPPGTRVELYSDSELLIHGMRGFVFRWRSQGWRNRRGLPIRHRDLWTRLIDLDVQLRIRWKWLRGHNGHPLQCRADALAYTAARSLASTPRLAA